MFGKLNNMENTSLSILKRYWGYDQFRPLQSEIIDSVVQGRDTLALLPTGGGKSICFQVPALLSEGICIVISPLIALMKDQVENLRKRGIEAVAIFSGMSKREVDITLDNCVYGKIKFLYLAPERLYSDLVRERIRYMKVNLFAIDEAHCISQWGYDFRPSYLELAQLRKLHPEVPFLALTATATPDVVVDIQEKLSFAQPNVFQKSFKRENLAYMVLPEEDKMGRMLRMLQKIGGSGVVYVRNRRETQEVAQYLVNHGISADYYHAGLDMFSRSQKQDSWIQQRIRVIVATNAFGMGIDKADVRFVLHLDIPDSLEAYYQEAGRGGRDGKKAFPVLMYQQQDRDRLWEQFEASFPAVKFIQQVYHYLCNFVQVAYGAGKGLVFNFDVVAFAKKYQLEILPTLSALKFLERDGWIALSEPAFIPSRIKFEVDYQELYKFQVQSSKHDRLIKLILRNYGGAFDFYNTINEMDFAKKLALPYAEVVERLRSLQKLEILSYIEKTDSAQLELLQARVDYKNLYIDHQFIASRKLLKKSQLTAIDHYLDTDFCRSIALQSYFGEADKQACGACDLCLLRQQAQNIEAKLQVEIQNVLAGSAMDVKSLIDALTIGDDKTRLDVLRKLVDTEKVILQDGQYHWKRG